MSKESYASGFCKAAEAAGVDPVQLAKFAKVLGHYPNEALVSLSGLSGHNDGDVARFLLEKDPKRNNDFSKYVAHATNPDLDYNSDEFMSKLDRFVNARLKEMRKQKIKRLLLEYVQTAKNKGDASVWSNENASEKAVSPTTGEKLDYMFSKTPWKKRDGVFLTANGKPLSEVDV